jgi:hypothetical protein
LKTFRRYIAPFSLLILCAALASAQSSVDVNIGFGTAHVSANSGGLDNTSSANAFGSCTPGTGDSYCQSLPTMSGFFLGFGGDIMLNKHYGFGAEATLQPTRPDYGPLQYRQAFYDFDGVYTPVSEKRFALRILGGVGEARTSFAYTATGCVGTAVCTTQTQPIGNSNHFQVHVGAGVQIYLSEHIFIRPQFDFHYVPSLNQQFGSNLVPQGMIWIGYTAGERK